MTETSREGVVGILDRIKRAFWIKTVAQYPLAEEDTIDYRPSNTRSVATNGESARSRSHARSRLGDATSCERVLPPTLCLLGYVC